MILASLILTLAPQHPFQQPQEPELTSGVRIEAAGVPIDVTIGHAAPLVFDFDGDSRRDLLVGEFGSGEFPLERVPERSRWADCAVSKVRIYRNVGTDTAPAFDGFEYLRAGEELASMPAT